LQQFRNSVVKFAAACGLFTGVCALGLTGCSKTDGASSSGKAGTVGVVDLDQISREVGWASEIDEDRKAAAQDINSQLQVFATSVKNAWTDKRKAIGDAAHLKADELKVINADQINGDEFQKLPLSKDQKDDFLRSANEASQTLQGARQQAEQAMQQREQRVIDSYREAMKPSVRRVAVSANVSTVLSTNPSAVFYYDPAVDLSNQVVDDLRKQMPEHKMPANPKMNYPEFKFTTVTPAAVTAPAAPAPVRPTEPSH
jgi:Skp family chaperone for outer membrane proteins